MRQASAEMEVTPEMVDAGVCAYDQARGSFADFHLVARVYRAMAADAPQRKQSHVNAGRSLGDFRHQ